MLKVLKNLKYSLFSVITIVILLCIQAAVDLELPNYTSKIVNNGIQSSGIENVAPDFISKEDFETILLFSDNDDEILSKYSLANSNDLDNHQERLIDSYLNENNNNLEEVYVIKDLKQEEIDKLSEIMLKPIIVSQMLQNEEMSSNIKQQILTNVPDSPKEIFENMELIDILKKMPEEQIEKLIQKSSEQVDQMQDTIKEQTAIAFVKNIYSNAGVDTNKIQMNYIFTSGLKMLGLALISMFSAVTIMLLSSRVAAKLAKTLRDKIFNKVLSFSNKEIREFSTASLITRTTNDVQQIQQLMSMLFRVVVYAPIVGIGGILKVLSQSDNSMAWIIGLAVISIFIIVGTLFALTMPRFKKLQDLIDKLNKVSREILTGLPVIRAFNTEKKEEERFNNVNIDLTKANIFVNRAMSAMMPMLMLIMNCISVLIIWVGGHNVDAGIMQVGDMLAFIQYTMQIVMSFLMISLISIMLTRASV